MLSDAPPPTPDDVSITTDGRRLDSKEAVLRFFAELDAEVATGSTASAEQTPIVPDPPGFDRVRIIETLNRHGVQYLIVGGIGAQLHGAHRATSDFDSLLATTT
jgi:hypothetical protein